MANEGAQPVLIIDEDGNISALILDGSTYRVAIASKLQDTGGTFLTPAKEDTLSAIKSTDGIKKIVDALPAGDNNIGNIDLASSIPSGTNEIGKVAQGTKAAASGGWPQYIVDSSGNIVGVVSDGGVYRLRTEAKIVRASDGNQINPATQETLAAIKDADGIKKIVDALPSGDNNIGNVDLASSIPAGDNNIGNVDLASSLPAGDNNIGNVDLASSIPAGDNNIGNVDLSSSIPAGSNEIGKVAQGTKAVAADAWPHYLVDSSGNIVGVVLDGGVYRLRTESKIVRASDGNQINPATQETLASIKDTDGIKKITDSLPSGTNEIGKVAQGTKAANADGWPTKLVDGVNGIELAVARFASISSNTRGILVMGQSDDLIARRFRTDIYGNLQTVPAASGQTAFGETRIAEPYQVANLINKYEIDSSDYGTEVSGGGTITHLPLQSAVRLYVTGASGDKARLRTHNYYRYQAGRGMFIRLTIWNTDAGQTNQVRRWGYFDDNDGLFWELSGTTIRVVRRTYTSGAAVDYPVSQANWNQDKLDGTGQSGITLDVTKGNIYECQFQWLGVGGVNWYVNGVLVHQMYHPNTIAGPYMRTATLPLTWEVNNSGASTASSLNVICGSIMIEGGADEADYTFGVFNSTDKTVGTTEIPLLSIRPKLLYNSIENRMATVPIAGLVATDGKRASYRLILNGTLTGPSWVSVGTQSSVEYDETATLVTGGITLIRGLLPNAVDSINLDLTQFFNNIARNLRRLAFSTNVDVLTITGKNEGSSGGNTLMRSSVTWQETR
jgi:hypothetical protein